MFDVHFVSNILVRLHSNGIETSVSTSKDTNSLSLWMRKLYKEWQ